jgi:hypothetical protein
MLDERRTEQSKVTVRWLVAAVLLLASVYLRRAGAIQVSWTVILLLTAGVAAANVAASAILRRGAPAWLRYASTGTDLLLISLLVGSTGGSASPFYYAYFIVLVSNSIRYGMRMAIFVALLYNIAYVAVLLVHPVGGDLTTEGVKILAFWGVALYAGYLATRFHRQARILEAYEETIAGLRARVEGRSSQPGGTEPPP